MGVVGMVMLEWVWPYLWFRGQWGWGDRGWVHQDQSILSPRREGRRGISFVLIVIVTNIIQGVSGGVIRLS